LRREARNFENEFAENSPPFVQEMSDTWSVRKKERMAKNKKPVSYREYRQPISNFFGKRIGTKVRRVYS
jgi:hypothetical protein